MTPATFAIPGDITLRTGGYIYDRRVLGLLPQYGVAAQHLQLPGSFPDPTAADLEMTGWQLAAIPPETVMIDGLAYGAMPAAVIARTHAPIVALVHHPLCLEAGLTKARQDALHLLEKEALALAKRVVVTSRITARTLVADFGVPAPRAKGSSGGPIQLLSVGAIVPRKACDLLVRSLARLKYRDWRLSIVGPTDRSPEALAAVDAAIRDAGLGERIEITGSLDEKQLAEQYASADAFVIASLYEGYGMVLAEAMARGLPVVCTTGGAAAETVPDGAGIKLPPGDEVALTLALQRILDDTDLRRRMADASWAAGQKLPRWEDAARMIAGVIEEAAQ
jgi:glycosyltransferase involved in cell wall biosynthesis